jgi:WD repeat-containing protein 76
MDAEKEIFDMVVNGENSIYALSQPKNEANCLYFAEGSGVCLFGITG